MNAVHDTHVEITLVHTAPELATSPDVVDDTRGDVPYPIVVQTDLRGCVHADQIVRHLADLHHQISTYQAALDRSGSAAPDVWTGIPLAGPTDPRWAFKVAEGRALDSLTGPATTPLLAAMD